MPYRAPIKVESAKPAMEPPSGLSTRVRKEWLMLRDDYAKGNVTTDSEADLVTRLAKARVNLEEAEALRASKKKLPEGITRAGVVRDVKFWSDQVQKITNRCKFFRQKKNTAQVVLEANVFEDLLVPQFDLFDSKVKSEFVQSANDYAKGVTAGKIKVSKLVAQACGRHLNDLTRIKDPLFKYKFSAYAADRVCRFISNLPHVKGRWAREKKRIHLEPWQCFIVCCLFGWVNKETNLRRFTEAYFEICRKNGKSVLAASIALYMFCADGEYGAEVYSGATTEKQAWEVFRPARLMAIHTPQLLAAAGITVHAKSLTREIDGSRFEPIIGKPGDGASPSCAVADELHEHDTPDLVDTMTTGMLAREQPLMLCITTAGFNLAGPCYEKRTKAIQVLSGALEDDRLFAVIYTIDVVAENSNSDEKGDDWADPASLEKANPNLGVSVDREFLLAAQRSAVLNVGEQVKFKTKHLDVWCSARAQWVSLQQWLAASDADLTEEELRGSPCFYAFDLASKSDIAAWVKVFVRRVNDVQHYYVFAKYYLPEDAIHAQGKNHFLYRKLHTKGVLTATDGATTDFERIRDDIIADAKIDNPELIVYDPFNATHMSQLLMNEGLNLVEFTQKPQNFAVPMDEIEAALKDARLHHDGDEMMNWMMSNVTVRPAKKGLFWPTKESPELKIDGPVAMIMAIAHAMARESDGSGAGLFSDMVVA